MAYCDMQHLQQYMQQKNFKNPFELDEEDTIITLDPISTHNINQPSKPQANNTYHLSSLPSNSEGSMFNPLNPNIEAGQIPLDDNQDIPLLQDIGIDVFLIKKRLIAILTLGEVNHELVESPDLSGPLIIAFLLGFLLLLGGKIHFSDIETEFIIGNVVMYFFFNFMAKEKEISLYSVTSYLGYSLLPMLILAIIGIVLSLNTAFGVLSSLVLAGWSSYTAGSLINLALNRVQGKILIIYPLFLFYLSFALIIIF